MYVFITERTVDMGSGTSHYSVIKALRFIPCNLSYYTHIYRQSVLTNIKHMTSYES